MATTPPSDPTIHAGDRAWYRPRGGERRRATVSRRTAKRIRILYPIGDPVVWLVMYVKEENLERTGGGC